jgi:hypothetical protein
MLLLGLIDSRVVAMIAQGQDLLAGIKSIKDAREKLQLKDITWEDEKNGGQGYLLLAFVEGEIKAFYVGETINKKHCRDGKGAYDKQKVSASGSITIYCVMHSYCTHTRTHSLLHYRQGLWLLR